MIVKHLIFDLDDTLYTSNSEMTKAIAFNMISFVANYFHISYDEAKDLRKTKVAKFGSTLEWLMSEGLSNAESYFAAVHPVDEAKNLIPDHNLRPFLISLGLPMTILTNAPSEHADRVLTVLGIKDLFDEITDIRSCELKGKPYPNAFKIALQKAGGTIKDSLFIDDQEKYVLGYENVGGTSAHIVNKTKTYQTGILPDFLQKKGVSTGKIFSLSSIYELPSLLKQLSDL